MKTKQILGAAVLALLGAAAQATVATSIVGNTTTYTENFNGGSSFSAVTNIPFTTDDYLLLSNPLGVKAASYSFSALAAVESLTVSFWYSAYSTAASWSLMGPSALANTGSLLAVTANNPGAGGSTADQFVSYTWNNLAAGNYSLSYATGLGELKVDDVKISVTAVPEPETYAMMLAGLGLIGTIARRRKVKQA